MNVVTDRRVQLAAQGDMKAFEEIYRSHHRRVFNQVLRMTRNVSEAEDLTQDVFLQLYRKLKTFRGESAFTTWLHRLTINVVLMHFRKTAVRPDQRSDELPEKVELVNRTAGSESTLILNRIYLEEALRQLSPGYRAVLILHDVEGYEHNQISQILGCAVGTSKSQLHKARLKLRRLLKKRAAPKQQKKLSKFGLITFPIEQAAG
jgi:RNA polymerase sigma-70 factor (ECF subfamily)